MKKSKIKHEFEILNSAISSLAARVKEIEGNTKQVNEPFSELPEKWCVGKLYPLESIAIVKWLNNEKGVFLNNMDDLSNMYLHYPYLETFYPFFHKLEGYTQISFSDFERLVLKKGHFETIVETYPGQNNVQNQTIRNDDPICGVMETSINISKPKLEVGKWYKYNNWLLCYASLNSDNVIIAYGFDNNRKWHGQDMFGLAPEDWKPATKEEVESALIEEAKRRGQKPHENLFYYDVLFNILYDRYGVGRQIIFNNGQWETIVEEPKQEIDWSVPGQLVCNENGAIWLTSGKHNEDKFYATLIVSKSGNPKGRYSEKVSKEDMIGLYKGSITLSNEPI